MDDAWFTVERMDATVTRVVEPHADPFLRANAWHVRGRDRDVLVDAGLGLVSLRASLPALFTRDPVLVVTHAHLDHAGGAYEFTDVVAHAEEAPLVERPGPASLLGAELRAHLGLRDVELPEVLVDATPFPGFDPSAYAVRPAPVTRTVDDGDVIDLGDRRLTVLHLPGHTPGSIGLLDETTGALFTGDALYDDGDLLDDLPDSDTGHYLATMRRLAATRCAVVYPGHGGPITPDRTREIAADYLRRNGEDPRP